MACFLPCKFLLPLSAILPTTMSQSQASQFSDAYVSSLYDPNLTDSLQIIQSDDFTPNLSFSQQSFGSVAPSIANSDFVRPPIPPLPIPPSLQRICLDRNNAYLVYSDMSKDDFVSWWLQTDFGKQKRIRWDARQQSNVWKHFDQVAKTIDGVPKVMCKQCKKMLDHPQQHGNRTAAMLRHSKGIGCQRGSKSPSIKQFLQEVLFISQLIYNLTNINISL